MANQILSMSKVRSILRLLGQGKSKREIARRCRVSRNSIDKYASIFDDHPLGLKELLKLTDKELYSVIAPPAGHETTHEELYTLFPQYENELKRIGVNKLSLWEEYKNDYPLGVQYSQFCEHFNRYLKAQQLSYIIDHKAGDKLMIDFAGKKLCITDYESGEIIPVEFFVGILPCSGYTYATACRSQKSEDFLPAIERCLKYMEGVPSAIVTDNLKPAVKKASKYDPELNASLSNFADHYHTCILPTRAQKPKDKALVEGAINILYTRVYAQLRDRIFHNLEDLNAAILELIDKHNQMLLQKKGISRKEQFIAVEKNELKPLPQKPFIHRKYQKAKVHPNCHVLLSEDKHEYSVPYGFVGQEVEIGYTHEEVEIFCKMERIATHQRDKRNHLHSTSLSHLHPNHQYYHRWSEAFFIGKGKEIGAYSLQLIEKIFCQVKHPEQGFKLINGLLQLANKHGYANMERAAEICLNYDFISYKRVQYMLTHLDCIPDGKDTENDLFTSVLHNNIRGADYFN